MILLLFSCAGYSGCLRAAAEPGTISVTTAEPAAGALYQDQLIDPELEGQLYAEELTGYEESPSGRRFLGLEYQYYRERQHPDDLVENGLSLAWRRETRDYGEFDLQATARKGDHQQLSNSSGSGRFTLHQYGLALDSSRLMDNTLGVLRSSSDPMLTSSFRLNLPSTLLAGGQTRVTREGDSALYASAGRIGRLDSGQLQGFELEAGEQYALGYSRKLGNRWNAGAHLVSLTGSKNTLDHQSAVAALLYDKPGTRDRYSAHALVDSKGHNGVWLDGDNRIRDWRYRYGIFRLEPGLLWSESTPANDQQGAYVRTEMQRSRYNLTAGLDALQTDIDNQPGIAGVNLYNGFVNGTWRVTRKTSVGGTLNLQEDSARDVTANDSHSYSLSGFVAHAFPVGRTRLQLQATELEQSGKNGNAYELIWDQDWLVSRDLSLSTSLSHERENGLDDDQDRSEASLLLRHAVTARLSWNGDISYTSIDSSSRKQQDNFNASLALAWRFLRNWDISGRATYNKVDGGVGAIGGSGLGHENTLLLNLRYSQNSGRPFTRTGDETGSNGYGRIVGTVFFDDNGDGRRQAGERAVSGVFVYLDRRYQSITDSDGRYVFESVPSGAHAVTLAEEDLPLPWGLLDGEALQVQVGVREGSTADFGLRRINE